ncbi:MAG: polysaccharide deacetylase family protein [Treponema sp.]|nr:polysaccharide deacetylase family protein [Treponema sp.]
MKTIHNKLKKLFFIFLVYLSGGGLGAKVVFRGLDVSTDTRLLFQADSTSRGTPSQGALFVCRLTDLNLEQITAFPEKIDLIEQGRTLQIRNSFGTMRIPVSGGLPRSIIGCSSFVRGGMLREGRVEDIATSRDGKWILMVESVTTAYGNLVLLDAASGTKTIVAYNIDRPDSDFPACWSPDSQVFVYTRGGRLYYYTVAGAVLSDERYRLIGDGAINSVSWGTAGDFFYLRGSILYRVRSTELFTRSVYTDFLEIGMVAGMIPFEFDPNFDRFWIAPDSRSMLLSKGGHNVFLYPLGVDYKADYGSSMPYLMVPRSCFNLKVLWSSSGVITVIASVFQKNGGDVMVYRLNTGMGRENGFVLLPAPESSQAALSPDGTKVLFWGKKGVVLYNYIDWSILQTISSRPAFSCVWTGSDAFIIGDGARIEEIRISGQRDSSRNLLCLAVAEEFGFEEQTGRILAHSDGTWFVTNGAVPWSEISNPALRAASLVLGRYQVYLEALESGPYENLPMIRSIASPVGTPLVPTGEFRVAAPPSRGSSDGLGTLITNGCRTGPQEVALCFDLYDDVTGLFEVLDTLNRFNLKVTFFLNGEFIRRYPAAAIVIADAGHETASMFFLPINLSDYHGGGDFIARGLTRTRDEFYRTSGSELSPFWHPPYYAVSSQIISIASEVGDKTVGRDVDPLDWVSRDDRGIFQYSASEMVDRVMASKQPGSIIPIRLGLLPGGRNDYLFSRINVLLDALVASGYSVVPVSTIIEHAR